MIKLKKGDIIIIFILMIAIILFILFYNNTINQKKAVIKIDGKIYKEIILNSDKENKEYIDFGNNKYMTLVYDKSGIYVEDVTCPDKICQKQGKINSLNQQIICLPNKTIIYIENIDTNNSKIDAVA